MRGRTQQDQLPILGDILGFRALELLARAETSGTGRLSVARRDLFLPLDPRFRENPPEMAGMWRQAVADGGFHTEVQCMLLGDLALAGVPGEAQVGFAAEVDQVSPFPTTLAVGLANDECGYLFSAQARARGGYEPDPAFWGAANDDALPLIHAAIRECLGDLAGR